MRVTSTVGPVVSFCYIRGTKMKELFIISCVCILLTHASPVSRIAKGEVATNAQHACMVLVIRPEMEAGHAVLGSGSIISTRHVLTAAHLVEGQGNTFIINFFVLTSRRSYNSTFALIHEKYDAKNHDNDIALIFLQGDNLFYALNIISISTANAQAGVVGRVTGYGFTSAKIGVASDKPMSANQTVAVHCNYDGNEYEASPSHFCAVDSANRNIVCPGDNGAGLYITNSTTGLYELIGVASHVSKTCDRAVLTGYTRVALFSGWIKLIANT